MASSLSNLANNCSEGINGIKCKYRCDDKKCEACRIKYKYCDCFLEYTNFKEDLIEYKCLCCNKNYQHKFDERFLMDTNFLIRTIISLFYCCEKLFVLMNIWMTGKNSMKLYYLKKKIFKVTKIWKILLKQITCM